MTIFSIAWKDTLIRFRDRNALFLMLAAPLILTAIMGAAFGGFEDSTTSLSDNLAITELAIAIVNHDQGKLGQLFATQLTAALVHEQPKWVNINNLSTAKMSMKQGELAAILYIPTGFTQGTRQTATIQRTSADEESLDTMAIQLHTASSTDPKSILILNRIQQVANEFSAVALGVQLGTVEAPLNEEEWFTLVQTELEQMEQYSASDNGLQRIQLRRRGPTQSSQRGGEGIVNPNANVLGYFAPSMAVLFLIFSMFESARSILREEQEGTLMRMMTTPSTLSQILIGKLSGAVFTGIVQLLILMVASRWLFDLHWGTSPLGMIVMVLAVVAATSSLGALITTFARNVQQATLIGSGIALLSAALGGNFVQLQFYPNWLQILSKLTLNRWAIEGFTNLTQRGMGVSDIMLEASVLFGIALCLFAVALWRLPVRYLH